LITLRQISYSLLFCLLFVSIVFAQNEQLNIQTFLDSNISHNFINTYLNDQINSINFNSKINIDIKFKKYNFFIKNYYASDITRLEKNYFKDFNNIKTGVGYYPFEKLNLSLNYLGFLYSDEKILQLKGSASNSFYFSGLYEDEISTGTLSSFINFGYKLENQIGEYNRGFISSGDLNLSGIDYKGYLLDGQVKLSYENLNPRKNSLILAKLLVDKSYNDNLVFNQVDGYFSRSRKDYYVPADTMTKTQFNVNNNIEQRVETIARFADYFQYKISDRVDILLSVNPYLRFVTKDNYFIPNSSSVMSGIYDAELTEVNLLTEATLKFDYEKLNFLLRSVYSERDEKHNVRNPERLNPVSVKDKEELEESKNNHSTRFSFMGNLFYNLSQFNRFEIFGSSSILKYDTQSETNYDDRDELNMVFAINHRYNNWKNLQLITSLDFNLYHTVYILSEKSSNNNWNRIFRLTSKSFLNFNDFLRTSNTFSILANYTVYDFEDIMSNIKSYSFRQFNWKDSTAIKLIRNVEFRVYAELKLYERGELNWGSFSTKPVSFFEDKIINPELIYYYSDKISFSVGYRYFEQKRYYYENGNRIYDYSVKTYGPVAKLLIDINRKSLIEIIGSHDSYIYVKNNPAEKHFNLYLNVIWNL
jgi:hypothetical protein